VKSAAWTTDPLLAGVEAIAAKALFAFYPTGEANSDGPTGSVCFFLK
jgi:hypothetical protein